MRVEQVLADGRPKSRLAEYYINNKKNRHAKGRPYSRANNR